MMNFYRFFLIVVGVFLFQITSAQLKITESSALRVGDDFAPTEIFTVLNGPSSQIDLTKYREELLVLDFFDTFCTACIANMPKLVKLQNEYKENINIVHVTWQDQKTIQKFFKTNAFLKEHQAFPLSIVADTLLHQYFPHNSVPHVAWVWKGKVIGITAADVLNSENIDELIKTGSITLPKKDDFLPLHTNKLIKEHEKVYSKITGYNPDLKKIGGFNYQRDSTTGNYHTFFNNIPILNAYLSVMQKIKKIDFLITKDRIEWKVKDKSKYNYDESEKEPTVWLEKNGICYERKDMIKRTEKEQAKVVFEDLNNYLGLDVRIGKANRKCLVLQRTDVNAAQKENNNSDQNLEGTAVLAFLLDYSKNYPPIIDEVKSKENISVGEFKDLDELNRQISAHGLILVPAEREIDVIIVEEG